jgi:hypothetical protein
MVVVKSSRSFHFHQHFLIDSELRIWTFFSLSNVMVKTDYLYHLYTFIKLCWRVKQLGLMINDVNVVTAHYLNFVIYHGRSLCHLLITISWIVSVKGATFSTTTEFLYWFLINLHRLRLFLSTNIGSLIRCKLWNVSLLTDRTIRLVISLYRHWTFILEWLRIWSVSVSLPYY